MLADALGFGTGAVLAELLADVDDEAVDDALTTGLDEALGAALSIGVGAAN